MVIEIKFRSGTSGYIDGRAVSVAFIVLCTSFFLLYLGHLLQTSRESTFPSAKSNGTFADVLFQCCIPYDQSRCSALSKKTNRSMICITNVQATTAYILPLVLYALQFYLVREFFTFTKVYSYCLTELYQTIALFTFALIAITVHGSSCFHFYTCMLISATGICLSGFIFYQFFSSDHKYFSRKIHDFSHDQRLSKKNQNRRVRITIPVS